MPPENSGKSSQLDLSALAGPAAGLAGMMGGKSQGALFVGMLQSRTVQQRLVQRFDLVRYYKVANEEDACRKLKGDTTAEEDTKTGIISIQVTLRDRVLASRIARGYVEELDRVVAESSTSAARRERIFLEQRLKAIKQDLDQASVSFSQFASNKGALDVPEQAKATLDAGLRLQTELATAEAELASVRQVYSADNVRVRSAEARVAALRRQGGKLSGDANSASRNPDSTDLYPSLRELPKLGLTYADLMRRVKVEETVWENLTKQYELAKVQEAKEIPTVRVLDPADVPIRKSGPQRSIIVVFGTFLSLLIACVAVFLMWFWDDMREHDERKMLLSEIGMASAASFSDLCRFLGRKASTKA